MKKRVCVCAGKTIINYNKTDEMNLFYFSSRAPIRRTIIFEKKNTNMSISFFFFSRSVFITCIIVFRILFDPNTIPERIYVRRNAYKVNYTQIRFECLNVIFLRYIYIYRYKTIYTCVWLVLSARHRAIPKRRRCVAAASSSASEYDNRPKTQRG